MPIVTKERYHELKEERDILNAKNDTLVTENKRLNKKNDSLRRNLRTQKNYKNYVEFNESPIISGFSNYQYIPEDNVSENNVSENNVSEGDKLGESQVFSANFPENKKEDEEYVNISS